MLGFDIVNKTTLNAWFIHCHYVNNDVDGTYILEVWQLGVILRRQMNDRQAAFTGERFLIPKQGSNPLNLVMTGEPL